MPRLRVAVEEGPELGGQRARQSGTVFEQTRTGIQRAHIHRFVTGIGAELFGVSPGTLISGVQVGRSYPLLTDPVVGAGEIGGERLSGRAADDRLNLMRQRRKLVAAFGVDVARIDSGLAG